MWHFLYKKCKLWVIKAFDRAKNEMITWVMASSSAKIFKRLYDKVKHLTNRTFYTDSWDVFPKILPKARHVINIHHIGIIKRDNSNIFNDMARFTHRTKVISRSENMINNTLKLWQAFYTSSLFFDLQSIFLSVFK